MGIAKLQFGRRLRKLREAKGLSQRQLGRLVWPKVKPDSVQGRISHYESERSQPSHNDLAQLANALNVSILELFADPITIEKSVIPLIQKWNELVKKRPRTMFDLKITDDDSPPYLRFQLVRVDPALTPRSGDHVLVGFNHAAPILCEWVKTDEGIYFNRLDNEVPRLLKKDATADIYGVVISHTVFRR